MMIPRFEDRIVRTDLWVVDFTNPIAAVNFSLGNLSTGNGTITVVVPRACKMVGYGISTRTTGDTVAGNWTVAIRKNGVNASLMSVNVTTTETKQTSLTVPWDAQPIFQAGDSWEALMAGPNKNGVFSFLTLEWELI